ncbi:uncharacterized protein LOC144630499 isoform X2 [Oculina patagonica]
MGSEESEAEDDSFVRDPDWGCTCRCLGKCATIQCQCKKRHFSCSKDCGCKTWKCTNRQQAVPILGITSGSDDENESSPRSNTKKKKN